MSENPIHTNQLIPLQSDKALARVSTQLSATNKILVKVGEQGLREWWEGLNEEWKEIFLINLEFATKSFRTTLCDSQQEELFHPDNNGGSPKELYYNFFNRDFTMCLNFDYISISKVMDIKFLYCGGTNIVDLKPISKLKKIEQLSIYSSNYIRSLEGIENCSEIKDITTNFIIDDLSPISNLKNIERIYFAYEGSNKVNLFPIRNLKKLRYLDLSCYEIDNTAFLQYLINLESLSIRGKKITNLRDMYYLKNLRKLWLYDTNIEINEIKYFKSINPNCEIY